MLNALADLEFKNPAPATLVDIVGSIGLGHLRPVAPPALEAPPRCRRRIDGLRHSKARDVAIGHHQDVSNTCYEGVLGPAMTYSCGIYPTADATLEEAQENKYRLIFDKLRLTAGDRLLDIGCGWGGMVRYAARRGVHALGVSLSAEQVTWAQKAIAEEGFSELAEVRRCDYRDIPETGFDGISAIGVSEHIGVKNYPSYFGAIKDKLRTGGLMLNQCITMSDASTYSGNAFTDRYIFPGGEITGSGRVITEIQLTGLEGRGSITRHW